MNRRYEIARKRRAFEDEPVDLPERFGGYIPYVINAILPRNWERMINTALADIGDPLVEMVEFPLDLAREHGIIRRGRFVARRGG